jgi:hypothetical protein
LLSRSADKLYQRIKASGLLAEQIEISALVQQLEQMSGNAAAAPSSLAVIERVARYFAEASQQEAHLIDDEIQVAIAILHTSVA